MKFLAKLWQGIKNLFNKMIAIQKKAVHVGVSVLENIKKVSDTSIPDILTALIPGDLDDNLVAKLREKLPVWLIQLRIYDQCAEQNDQNAYLACIIKAINESDKDRKKVVYTGLAGLIVELTADGKLDWTDSVVLAQYVYRVFIKGEDPEKAAA